MQGASNKYEFKNCTIESIQSDLSDTEYLIVVANAQIKLTGNTYINGYTTKEILRFGGSVANPTHVECDTNSLSLSNGGNNSAYLKSTEPIDLTIAESSNTILTIGQLIFDSSNNIYIYSNGIKQIAFDTSSI